MQSLLFTTHKLLPQQKHLSLLFQHSFGVSVTCSLSLEPTGSLTTAPLTRLHLSTQAPRHSAFLSTGHRHTPQWLYLGLLHSCSFGRLLRCPTRSLCTLLLAPKSKFYYFTCPHLITTVGQCFASPDSPPYQCQALQGPALTSSISSCNISRRHCMQ